MSTAQGNNPQSEVTAQEQSKAANDQQLDSETGQPKWVKTKAEKEAETMAQMSARLDRLDEFGSVTATTTLYAISDILTYVSECDFNCTLVSDKLSDNALSGRGYLMQLLQTGIDDITSNASDVFSDIAELKLAFEAKNETFESQQAQLAKLSNLKSCYEQLVKLDCQDGEEAKKLKQKIADLSD